MAHTIHTLISEAKRSKLSLITSLTEEDVMLVWDAVAALTEKLMMQQKGVCISGLGTFTFSKRRIDVGSNKVIVIQRPVFVLSEKFAQTHSLRYTKQHTSGQIPLLSLNLTILSNATGLSRDLVEATVREVLQALSRAVAARKSIEFDLGRIGRLSIHDGRAKMCFFREFVFRVDGSEDFELAFRLNTASSIMSNPFSSSSSSSRASTCLSLPRIVEPLQTGDDFSLNLYSREDGDVGMNGGSLSSRPSTTCTSTGQHSPLRSASTNGSTKRRRMREQMITSPAACMSTIQEETGVQEDEEEEELDDGGRVIEGVRTVDKYGKVSPFVKDTATQSEWSGSGRESGRGSSVASRRLTPKPAMLFVGKTSAESARPSLPSRQLRSSSQSRSSVSGGTSGTTASGPLSLPPSRPSTCSHRSPAGQELCYLCHQRAMRNAPVDLVKEKARLEQLRNEILLEYCRQKDFYDTARAEGTRTKNRLFQEEMATFNLEVAERVKKQKSTRSSEFSPSYVFPDRSMTPALHLKQQLYCRDLDQQIDVKQTQMKEETEEEEAAGRKEQDKLAKELEVHECMYRQTKAQNALDYQRALEEQVNIKKELLCPQRPRPASSGRATPTSASQYARSLFVPKPNIVVPFSQSKPTTAVVGAVASNSVLKNVNLMMPNLKMVDRPQTSSENATTHHQPLFGVRPTQEELRSREREKAKALFLEQLAMVSDKQKKMKEKILMDRLEEEDMLQNARESLRSDHCRQKERQARCRQSLEQDWYRSMRDKQQTLLEELHRAREHGLLLHQQCEKYQRCRQCQRKRENGGKSNLLHETRYISGSRLMV